MSDVHLRGTAALVSSDRSRRGWALVLSLLSLILVAGLGMRLAGIAHGAPFISADEWIVGKGAMRILTGKTWNVLYYYYPTLLTYLLVPFAAVLHVVAHVPLTQLLPGLDTQEALPSQFPIYLAGRLLVALMGTTTIAVSFESARRLVGVRGGLIAAALVGFSGVLVYNSQYLTTDVPSALMAALTLLAGIVAWERRSPRWILASAFLAGLSASTKYNVGLVIVVAVMAWLSIIDWRTVRARSHVAEPRDPSGLLAAPAAWRTLVLIPAFAIAGFAIATPAIILAPGLVLQYLQLQAAAYGIGTTTSPVPSLAYNLQYLWDTGLGPVSCILVATGTVRLVARRRAPETFVFVFGVAYLILMSTPPLHFSRNLVPLVPFAAIAGAEAGDLLIDSLIALVRRVAGSSSIPRLAAVTASVVLVAVMASNPLAIGLSASGELVKPDTRVVAYEWLENHLPTGTRVARDGYTPVLVAPRFDGELYWPLAQNGVAWYRSHGFAYLVLSDYVYLRVTPGDPLFADYSAMLSLPVVYRIGPDGGANGPTIVIVRL